MKKTFMKFLAVAALAVASISNLQAADGELTFAVGGANPAIGRIMQVDGTTRVNTSFLGQLYVSSSLNGVYTALGSPASFTAGGNLNGSTFTIAGTAPNQTYFYKVAAWSASSGATFEQALGASSGFAGISAGTQINLGGTVAGSPPTVFTANSNTFNTFSLAAVPEPTTVALAVMGGLGLLARRRRNA